MKRWIAGMMAVMLVEMALFGAGCAQPTDLQRAVRKGDLMRIHILAHDDSERQQEIKLMVRDAILAVFTPLFEDADSAQEAADIVRENLPLAEETAKAVLRENGQPARVQAQFGRFDFPERVYGGQVMPAGEYTALRIVLGDGEGKNWWCVMYPPLCFSGEDYEGEVRFESSLVKWWKKRRDGRKRTS